MPYLPNIPIATQTLKSSQPQIQGNFQALNTVYGVDHYAYDEANPALVGRHKRLTIPVAAGVPSPGAGELAIYSKTASGGSQIFFKRDGSPTEYQLTNSTGLNIDGAPGFLPIRARFCADITFPVNVFTPITISVLYSDNIASITGPSVPLPGPPSAFYATFTTPLPSSQYFPNVWSGSPTTTERSAYMDNSIPPTTNEFYFYVNAVTGSFTVRVYCLVIGP